MSYDVRLYPIYRAMQWASRRAPILRSLLPKAPILALRDYLAVRAIAGLPDRRYLEELILPTLAGAGFGRLLFVGCRRYTRHYGRHFARVPTQYWTTDCDPTAAAWGTPGRHVVCDIRAIAAHVPAGFFDVVVLNGVFGFGVNDEPSMNETLAAIHEVLAPDGRLIVGWDRGLIPDPSGLANMQRLFRRRAIEPLPERKTFADHQHVYDCFTALPI